MKLKQIFDIMEIKELIPALLADIPHIGRISNLYDYMFNCLFYCLNTKDKHSEEYQFQYNQMLTILAYFKNVGSLDINEKITPEPIKYSIPIEVLEIRAKYLVAEQTGWQLSDIEIQRIKSLWEQVIANRCTNVPKEVINELSGIIKEIGIRQVLAFRLPRINN